MGDDASAAEGRRILSAMEPSHRAAVKVKRALTTKLTVHTPIGGPRACNSEWCLEDLRSRAR